MRKKALSILFHKSKALLELKSTIGNKKIYLSEIKSTAGNNKIS